MGRIWLLRIRGFGFGFEFWNPRIRIRILSLANIFEMISLSDEKQQKFTLFTYWQNNKSDKWFQTNSNSIQNVTNSVENFTNLLQNLSNLVGKVYNAQNFSLQNQNLNPCVFTSNPTRIRIWEFRSDFSDSDIRPITSQKFTRAL